MFLFTEGGHSIPVVDPVSAADAGGVFGLLWLVIGLPLLGATVLLLGGVGGVAGPSVPGVPVGGVGELLGII